MVDEDTLKQERVDGEVVVRRSFCWTWRHWFLIVLFSIGCYWRDLDGAWILDDKGTITMNPVVTGEATPFFRELWNRDFWGRNALNDPSSHKSWRPLCTATYRLNYILATEYNQKTTTMHQPPPKNAEEEEEEEEVVQDESIPSYWFHVVDRILHGLVTGLCYIVASYCLSNKSSSSQEKLTNITTESSLWVAVLFAIHPIHVESVANSTGRAEVLCALFYFSGFVAYASSCYRQITLFIPVTFVLVMTWASMLCKEHGITLPLLCIIWDVYLFTQTNLYELYQYYISNNASRNQKRWNECHQFIMKGILLLLGTGLLAWWRLSKNGPGTKADFVCEQNPVACNDHFLTRFVHYSYLWCFNFFLLLFPEWLCPDWSGDSIPILSSPFVTDPRFPCCILLWFVLFFFLYDSLQMAILPSTNGTSDQKKRKVYITCVCWMLLPFLMSSNLLIYVGFVVADRILYLPSFGFCMLLVETIDHLFSTSSIQPFTQKRCKNDENEVVLSPRSNEKTSSKTNSRLVKVSILSLISLFYLLKQQAQTKRWSDPVLLWGEGYRINPSSCITGKEYGMALVNANRGRDAVPILQSNHEREIHGKWFIRNISDRFKESRSHYEEKISEWGWMASVLQTRFKLVTAMGNSGSCVEARPIIDEGITWADNMLQEIETQKGNTQPQGTKHSLDDVEKSIILTKSFLLVSKSRCSENVALMGKAAYDAVMLVPGNDYVKNHALRINDIISQLSQQNIQPHMVLIDWELNPDGQSAEIIYQQRAS